MTSTETLDLTGLKAQMESILATTKREQRPPTADEERRLDDLVTRGHALKAQKVRHEGVTDMMRVIDEMIGGSGDGRAVDHAAAANGSMLHGSSTQRLAQTPFFRYLAEKRGHLSASGPVWTTPPLDLIRVEGGAALLAISTDTGSAGQLLVPEHVEGIVPLPTRPLVVADLMGSGTTESNSVTYMAEETIVNAATVVPPGGLKPQSDITFAARNEPTKKIATWVEIVTELLEDVQGMSTYLHMRLMRFVRLAEDDQLLNGSGVGDNFTGIVHRPGLADPIARAGTENNADVILRQIAAIETATQEDVSGITMNPGNWSALLLLKNVDGDYIASGGPFGTPQRKTLWGRDVVVTPAQALGSATVGAFKTAAQFRRRTPIRVVASNSHADFFIRNKVALLAEERGALVVFREAAFGVVTNLTQATPPAA